MQSCNIQYIISKTIQWSLKDKHGNMFQFCNWHIICQVRTDNIFSWATEAYSIGVTVQWRFLDFTCCVSFLS